MKIKNIVLVILCILCFASCAIFAQQITLGPILSCPTKCGITMKIVTNKPIALSIVYWKVKGTKSVFDEKKTSRNHVIVLKNLEHGQKYYYRIKVGKSYFSPIYSFYTAVGKSNYFDFVAYGDTRSNHSAHCRVLRLIESIKPRFALHTGDIVANGDMPDQWKAYFNDLCVCTHVGENVPIYYVVGNHERESHYYFDFFVLPSNNSMRCENYYSFNYGSAHFIALDTQIPINKTSPQYKWLVNDLEKANNDFLYIFVFFHKPPFSSGEHGCNTKLKKILHPLFVKYHVNVVFNGHDHGYERSKQIDGVIYVVTGGGGAPLYKFAKAKWAAYSESCYHVVKVKVTRSKALCTMIRTDGTIGDRFFTKARK